MEIILPKLYIKKSYRKFLYLILVLKFLEPISIFIGQAFIN